MKTNSLGFIGGGRIARILLGGWKHAGVLPDTIVVSDPNEGALRRLQSEFPAIDSVGPDCLPPAGQEIVFLAVHPPVLSSVLGAIRDRLNPQALVVSLAPKFTFARLEEMLGGFTRLARMIPNAPSLIGAGFNPIAFGRGLSSDDKESLKGLMAPLGECPEVEEKKLEGFALISAMGPTYFWFQLQVLREMAEGFGLSSSESKTALLHMVQGAARTLLESGRAPGEVVDLIPVKPLGDMEAEVVQMYHTHLSALFEKLKPA